MDRTLKTLLLAGAGLLSAGISPAAASLTDWYTAPEDPNDRMKVTVYILDRALRADGLKISVFRQTHGADGAWTDASVDPATSTKLEDAILTRARELRLATTPPAG